MSDYRCNGWANYATWSVALFINESDMGKDAAQAITDGNLRDWVEETFLADWNTGKYIMDAYPLAGQLLSAALSDVDWAELSDHFSEEEQEQEEEEDSTGFYPFDREEEEE